MLLYILFLMHFIFSHSFVIPVSKQALRICIVALCKLPNSKIFFKLPSLFIVAYESFSILFLFSFWCSPSVRQILFFRQILPLSICMFTLLDILLCIPSCLWCYSDVFYYFHFLYELSLPLIFIYLFAFLLLSSIFLLFVWHSLPLFYCFLL